MDIKALLAPLRRWWWLLIIAPLVAGGASYFIRAREPKVYTTTATLMIGRTLQDPNPTSTQFYLEQQLAIIYADIANREPVRRGAMEALGLQNLPDYEATAVAGTPLIEISVTDTDPVRAQVVANELANQLVLRNPTSASQENAGRQKFINEQLDTLQIRITDTQKEIENLTQELATLDNARLITDKQAQISAMEQKLNTLQATYASLVIQTQSGAINTLNLIEPAETPTRPSGTSIILTTILSAAIGFLLATIAAYAIEFVDKSLKTPEEVTELLPLPVVGRISVLTRAKNMFTYVSDQPRSVVADDFRLLRTNLDFYGVDKPVKTILVTSSDVSDGKSIVAANLAQIISQTGKKTILVDADFRNSHLQRDLKLDDLPGLSDVITKNDLNIEDVLVPWNPGPLSFLPVGTIPPNPTELLGSMRMERVLATLKEMSDVVIIDGPPFLVADASVIAAKVDGVLLVVTLGNSRKAGVISMGEQIKMIGARVLGIVLNKMPATSAYYRRYGKRVPATEPVETGPVKRSKSKDDEKQGMPQKAIEQEAGKEDLPGDQSIQSMAGEAMVEEHFEARSDIGTVNVNGHDNPDSQQSPISLESKSGRKGRPRKLAKS